MENNTERTGWFVYYSSDNSGIGSNTPRYVNSDIVGWDHADVKDYIIHSFETWAIYNEDKFRLRYEANVVPPVEEVDNAITEAKHRIENAHTHIHELERFKEKHYYGKE